MVSSNEWYLRSDRRRNNHADFLCLTFRCIRFDHVFGVAAHYRELASKRGQEFVNVYDVGWRRNLQLFFNIGPDSP